MIKINNEATKVLSLCDVEVVGNELSHHSFNHYNCYACQPCKIMYADWITSV